MVFFPFWRFKTWFWLIMAVKSLKNRIRVVLSLKWGWKCLKHILNNVCRHYGHVKNISQIFFEKTFLTMKIDKIGFRNFKLVASLVEFSVKNLDSQALTTCRKFSVGAIHTLWVLRTLSKFRGIQRTLNQHRTTSRKETAYPISIYMGNSQEK